MEKPTTPTTKVANNRLEGIEEFFDLHMSVADFKSKLSNIAMNHLTLYILHKEYKDHAHRLPEIEALDEHPMYADDIIEDVNILRNFINED